MPGWQKAVVPDTPLMELDENVQKVQARVVQHHYVRSQLRNIERSSLREQTMDTMVNDPYQLFHQEAQQLLSKPKKLRAWLESQWNKLNTRLQSADLTINFEAASWFTTPNHYESYTQMYERGIQTVTAADGTTSQQFRLVANSLNNPVNRSFADDKVTFSSQAVLLSGNASSYLAFIGKSFGAARVMSPGGLNSLGKNANGQTEYEAVNPHFNPRSKQIFAGLNYGRRPHGSITSYGMSHLVLNPKFKTNALYFGSDTFSVALGAEPPLSKQVSYNLLAGIYATMPSLRVALYDACIRDQRLQDEHQGAYLIEAHLFEPLTFSQNIECIYVSLGDSDAALRKELQKNAKDFARRIESKVVFMD